ncbi:hypothetical protein C8R45DRAFT_522522 [Mycena sanguinolenta]|nr:hypothetical protein C8R45DRAFT_522522 [Mycena sanguinolenta]
MGGVYSNALLVTHTFPNALSVVITRSPEIITCFKLHINTATGIQNVFIIFDSHPKTEYPYGAGLLFNTSLDAAARRMSDCSSKSEELSGRKLHDGKGSVKILGTARVSSPAKSSLSGIYPSEKIIVYSDASNMDTTVRLKAFRG